MDSNIIIDEDFTIDVVEADDNEDIEITDNVESFSESVCNDVNVKEEFDIDLEDNYLIADKFVDFTEIKTELEDKETEQEKEISSIEKESPPQTEVEEVTVQPPSDKVPENDPNITSPDLTLNEANVTLEKNLSITSAATLNKENIFSTQKQRQGAQLIRKTQKAPNTSTSIKALATPLERRALGIHTNKRTQPPTKTNNYQRRQMYNDKSMVPLKPRNQRKLSLPKFHRNYGTNRFNALVPNSFFTRKSQQNFRHCNRTNYNNGTNGFHFPHAVNSNQMNSVDWQTYSVILSALNQLLGNNQNLQYGDNSPVPFRKKRFSRSKWRNRARSRPQIWTNEYENIAPSFNNSTQLQMYTSILSAISQLNNSMNMQNCLNYSPCSNSVKLQMSFLNVFRSF